MNVNAIWLQNRYSQVVFKSDGRGLGTILCLGLVLHGSDCFSGPSKGRIEVER